MLNRINATRLLCNQRSSTFSSRRITLSQIVERRHAPKSSVNDNPQSSDIASEAEVESSPFIQIEDFDGLSPEEDEAVPGGYFEAMNGNTRLGKAVRSACDEIETLASLESEMIDQAQALLIKLGLKKTNLRAVTPNPQVSTKDQASDKGSVTQ